MDSTEQTATATVQDETATVRITRWDFPPGTQTGGHRHGYDYVVVPVIGGVLTITSADGSVSDVPIEVGTSYSRVAGTEHNVENRTDSTVAFVEIELLEHEG